MKLHLLTLAFVAFSCTIWSQTERYATPTVVTLNSERINIDLELLGAPLTPEELVAFNALDMNNYEQMRHETDDVNINIPALGRTLVLYSYDKAYHRKRTKYLKP